MTREEEQGGPLCLTEHGETLVVKDQMASCVLPDGCPQPVDLPYTYHGSRVLQ